jgi:hypothetical protein
LLFQLVKLDQVYIVDESGKIKAKLPDFKTALVFSGNEVMGLVDLC